MFIFVDSKGLRILTIESLTCLDSQSIPYPPSEVTGVGSTHLRAFALGWPRRRRMMEYFKFLLITWLIFSLTISRKFDGEIEKFIAGFSRYAIPLGKSFFTKFLAPCAHQLIKLNRRLGSQKHNMRKCTILDFGWVLIFFYARPSTCFWTTFFLVDGVKGIKNFPLHQTSFVPWTRKFLTGQ